MKTALWFLAIGLIFVGFRIGSRAGSDLVRIFIGAGLALLGTTVGLAVLLGSA